MSYQRGCFTRFFKRRPEVNWFRMAYTVTQLLLQLLSNNFSFPLSPGWTPQLWIEDNSMLILLICSSVVHLSMSKKKSVNQPWRPPNWWDFDSEILLIRHPKPLVCSILNVWSQLSFQVKRLGFAVLCSKNTWTMLLIIVLRNEWRVSLLQLFCSTQWNIHDISFY